MGITASHRSILNTLKDVATRWQTAVLPSLALGLPIVLVADNIDFNVHARFTTPGRGNRSFHWISSAIIIGRVSGTNLNDSTPQKPPQQFDVRDFYHSAEDEKRMRSMQWRSWGKKMPLQKETQNLPSLASLARELHLSFLSPQTTIRGQDNNMPPLQSPSKIPHPFFLLRDEGLGHFFQVKIGLVDK